MFFKLLFVSGVIILSEPAGNADVYTLSYNIKGNQEDSET